MKLLVRLSLVAIMASVSMGGMTGCEKKGPFEKAGEHADDAVDNVKKGESPFHKRGAMEKAGDAVDDTLGTNK